jgi:NAD(P)-dependent dehydrogenase (short-subunit alcohol dehydrogenase family)
MEISNKAILVTGAASGLGAATVRRLAAHGALVVGIDTQPAESTTPCMHFVVGDVTSPDEVQRAIELCSTLGGLFGVVHCAGILRARRVVSREGPQPLEEFAEVIRVNLIGSFNVVRLAAAAMQKNAPTETQERGVIVLTASIAAWEGQVGQAAYSASKGGVAAMIVPVAREMAQWGVRVVAIAPGVFDTPMMAVAPAAVREPLLAATLFPKRFGLPEEFAALVQHVLENPMINATTIRLDGGLRMPPR